MSSRGLRIAIVADVFPPLRSSGAVQLRDLALELVRQGHHATVMVPSSDLASGWQIDDFQGVQVLRLRSMQTKDVGYVSRTAAEFLLPFLMKRQLRQSPLKGARWDGVIWYSPTIFLGPMAKALKRANGAKAYLIIRDIFPEWAADMGLLRRYGLPYGLFKWVAHCQYSVADVIGVQTPANLPYFNGWARRGHRSVEVLQNWLADPVGTTCSINVDDGPLRGRKVLVYAGNMGVAQGLDVFLDLAARLALRDDIGFLFVGRGTHAEALKRDAERRRLPNVVFHDEIDPLEIPALYEQCHVGLVSLDPRHRTHNIPGKFLTYMQSGLPVLARVNPGNDLIGLVHANRVGMASVSESAEELATLVLHLLDDMDLGSQVTRDRCRSLFRQLFTAEVAVKQVILALAPRAPTAIKG
jgi:glycosyltransferase involved in cell wall biosynthesis